MGLALTVARRSLLVRPGRTIFSILGIAVGIATVVGIFTLDHNTLLGRMRSTDPDWQADIEVSPSVRVVDPKKELKGLGGVQDATAAFQNAARITVGTGEGAVSERIHLIALESSKAPQLGAYFLREGRDLAADAAVREAMLGADLAQRLGVAVGDVVLLSRPRRAPSRECVNGQWLVEQRDEPPPRTEVFTVVGLLEREGVGRRARGAVAVVDFDRGQELFEGAHVATRYWVKRDPTINLETLQANLGEAWSYDLKKSVIIGQAADERAFRNGVRFAGLLAMVLGLFVIFHTLSMSLLERTREVGVLHALGTTRAQIGRVFLCEASIVAGAGGLCGLAGGLAMAFVLLRAGITTVGKGRPVRIFDVPWELVTPLVLAGIAVALFGSIYPLLKATNTNAVAALRGEDTRGSASSARGFQWFAAFLLALVLPGVYFGLVPVIGETERELVGVMMLGMGVLALLVVVPLVVPRVLAIVCELIARPFRARWPLAGSLTASTMKRGPARISGAVAGIALVTAGFVGLRGMTSSLQAEIDVWSREAFRDKVFVRNLPSADFDTLADGLKAYPNVLGVEPNDARTYAPFLLVGVHEEELVAWGPCKEDPTLVERMRAERGVILSRRVASHRQYEIGDLVHVQTPSGPIQSFPVIAISDAYGYFPHPDERLYGVVSDRWMQQDFCIDRSAVTRIAVQFEPGTDPDEAAIAVRTAIGELLPGAKVSVETGEFLYGWHASDIARDFVLFDIIIGLTVILAGLGVLNGQLLSALERSKELGVLKALGMSREQVAGMVLLESAVVGLVGGGLGALLGSAVTPFIVRALQVLSGLPLPQRGAGVWIAVGVAGGVVVAVVAGIYPVWRMNRGDAVAAVRMG